MQPCVIARIFGGLGNQIFCYAAARRLAVVNGVPLRLDTRSGFAHDGYRRQYLLDRFIIRCEDATAWESFMHLGGRVRRRAVALINRRMPFERRWYVQEEATHQFDPRLLTLTVRRPIYVTGYWQSEKYFLDAEEVIRSELTFRGRHSVESVQMAAKIEATESVSIHVRCFDEVQEMIGRGVWNSPLSLEYYIKATRRMATVLSSPTFYCFSDNVGWARTHLRLEWPVEYVDVNTGRDYDGAVDDLWLISKCRHHIVSNSTFSWWGAWIGRQDGGLVIGPQKVLQADRDYFPEGWRTV